MRGCKLLPLVCLKIAHYLPVHVGPESHVDSAHQHGNAKVTQAVVEQMSKVSYCISSFFKTAVVEEAARMLVDSTGGHMTRAFIVNSGEPAPSSSPQCEHVSDQQQARKPWKRR